MTQSIADIAESKCLLVIGTNTFEQHPLIGRRIMQAKKNGAKIIYADPRLTPTGKIADLHLQFYSGTDVALMNCFMHQILKNGWENKEFIAKRTKDFEKVKAGLADQKIPVATAEVFLKPDTTVPVGKVELAAKILELMDALDENDDVKKVHANFDIPDEILDKVGG